MARQSKYISIEGLYSSNVLGTFRIIRGYATLQDLARISVPYAMTNTNPGRVAGYQRNVDEQHATEIKRYLEQGTLRFIPEIILSIRADNEDELDREQRRVGVTINTVDGLAVYRRWRSSSMPTHIIQIERYKIHELQRARRIRRIDGNHRLHLAAQLAADAHSPNKYLAPFCAVLLGPPSDPNDDFVEAMLFHTINSKALLLDSEHALNLILGQALNVRPLADDEFANDPSLYLTRLLQQKMNGLPQPQLERLGQSPSTALNAAAVCLIDTDPVLRQARVKLDQFADGLFAALGDMLARLPATVPELCKSEFFIELASMAWNDSGAGDHNTRINRAVATIQGLGTWLGRDGLDRLKSQHSLARQLFEMYRVVRSRVPKRIFLARWYPDDQDGAEKAKADRRLNMISRALDDLRRDDQIDLILDDPGTRAGGTFPIHQKMYEALARNDIILVDLSGVRPNVCVEAGYALERHTKERLLFLFQPSTAIAGRNLEYNQPPFDLNTFRYEMVNDAAEIPDKLKPHIREIWKQAQQ